VCEFITAPLQIAAGTAPRFFVNADGLGAKAALRVELLTAELRPVPGYSGRDAAVVRRSGFQTPVAWGGRTEIRGLPGRVRLRVVYEGARREGIRFYACYLQPSER
jgi:hypothetical protein